MSNLLLHCDGRRLTVTPPDAPAFSLPCTPETLALWRDFATRDAALNHAPHTEGAEAEAHLAALRALGHDLFGWLDGLRSGWLHAALTQMQEPTLTVSVPPRPRDADAETAHLFLDLPWELLADRPERTLAEWADDPLVVLRRLGPATAPAPAEPYRLSMVFMAAAPEDQELLDFEAEECALLDAADTVGMDLFVEESGTLAGLASLCRTLDFVPTVLHLSCHGMPGVLCLEAEDGPTSRLVRADELRAALPAMPPLVFLSACGSGERTDDGAAFSRRLIGRGGVRAVVSWRGEVADHAARLFAQTFYGALCARVPVAQALRRAQTALIVDPDSLHDRHRVRVLLAPDGGGPLVAAGDARLPFRRDVQAAPAEVPFVGRRHELRGLLTRIRRRQAAGALIQGIGQIGKTRLAHRVAQRLFQHRPVVLGGTWYPDDLTAALQEAYPEAAAPAGLDAAGLDRYLSNLLQHHAHGQTGEAPPLLLVLDGFDQMLGTPRRDQAPGVDPVAAAAVAALLRAFAQDPGRSFLLITSRCRFTLPWQGRDLAADLVPMTLQPLSPADRVKLLRAQDPDLQATPDMRDALLSAGGGIPGLQLRLGTLCPTPDQAADACAQMTGFWQKGDAPDGGVAAAFLRDTGLPRLLAWLSPEERHILAALKPVPVLLPHALLRAVLADAGMDGADGRRVTRLQALSLLHEVADADGRRGLAAVPAAAACCAHLPRAARKRLARLLCTHAAGQPEPPPIEEASFYTRIALWSAGPLPADPTPQDALGERLVAGEDLQAGRLASLLLRHIRVHRERITLPLLRRMTRALLRDRRYAECLKSFQLGAELVAAQGAPTPEGATFTYEYAQFLFQTVEKDAARATAQSCLAMFQALGPDYLRDTARTWDLLASDAADRGAYDEALRIRREEELPLYARLGDAYAKAVAWGRIADVHTTRYQIDEAMRIRTEEQLPVLERLGDLRARAVIWGKVAELLTWRTQWDAAWQIVEEEQLPVLTRLGDVRETAIAWGRLADIHTHRGAYDEAMRIRREHELPVYQELGDLHAEAITWGQLADLHGYHKDLETAYRLRKEEALPRLERLGDARATAICRANLAINLWDLGAATHQHDIAPLMWDALCALRHMDLPESEEMEQNLIQFAQEVADAEGKTLHEILQRHFPITILPTTD